MLAYADLMCMFEMEYLFVVCRWPIVGYVLLGAMFVAHIGATAGLTMQ